MSNETMTDARALEIVRDNLPPHYPDSPLAEAFQRISARLRGEAAQGEQRAVAWQTRAVSVVTGEIVESWRGCSQKDFDKTGGAPYVWEDVLRIEFRALYECPQPVAVAGGAVRAPLPVPTDILEARAQGRAEALAIILGLDAEEGLDDYTDSIPPGPAGEWGTAWNEEKLRELLRADDSAWSLLQESEGEY